MCVRVHALAQDNWATATLLRGLRPFPKWHHRTVIHKGKETQLSPWAPEHEGNKQHCNCKMNLSLSPWVLQLRVFWSLILCWCCVGCALSLQREASQGVAWIQTPTRTVEPWAARGDSESPRKPNRSWANIYLHILNVCSYSYHHHHHHLGPHLLSVSHRLSTYQHKVYTLAHSHSLSVGYISITVPNF